jgi:CcmD family protein
MGAWGFVALAYGIVWTAIIVYLFALKGRVRRAEARLTELKSRGNKESNAQ